MTDKHIVKNSDGSYSLWVDSQLGQIQVMCGTFEECADWAFNDKEHISRNDKK